MAVHSHGNLCSSRRLSGSTTRTVCSFWFATTSRPPAGGAGLATRSSAEVRTIMKTKTNDKRTNMGHLDETAFSLEFRESSAEYIFSRSQRLRLDFFFTDFLRRALYADGFALESALRVFFGSFARTRS